MLNSKKYGDYKIIKKLGQGGFGNVFLSQKNDEYFALKFIDKELIIEEDLADNIKTELNLMKTIHHPYIVNLFEILSSAQKIIMVMEYVNGGDLFDEIKRGKDEKLSESSSRHFFQQIITALEYCHNKNIVHRDLKPENILYDKEKNCIKISDFGLATILKEKDEKLSDFAGTTNYIAPEIIKETGKIFSSGGYSGQLADIWSAGVILYNMASGENPFYHSDKAISINNILNANVEYPSYFSNSLIDLLKHIFVTQPKLRFTIKNIKEHPWFIEGYKEDNIILNSDIANRDMRMIKADNTFTFERDEIPYGNCFVIIALMTGKWVTNMFKEGKKEFEVKEVYGWFVIEELEKLQKVVYMVFEMKGNKCSFTHVGRGTWDVEIKIPEGGNVKFEMIIYQIPKNEKNIIVFSFKEGNKLFFAKVMKNFNDKAGNIVRKF